MVNISIIFNFIFYLYFLRVWLEDIKACISEYPSKLIISLELASFGFCAYLDFLTYSNDLAAVILNLRAI